MNDYNPPKNLLAIAKIKFKWALLPIGIIVISLALQMLYDIGNLRYLSIFALLYYLVLLLLFRIDKAIGPAEENELLSPIHGKVIAIHEQDKENLIVIRKLFHHPADLRLSDDNDLIDLENAGKKIDSILKHQKLSYSNEQVNSKWTLKGRNIYYFPESGRMKGILTGIIPGNGICSYHLPKEFTLNVEKGEKVEAGVSIIGVKE